MSVNMFVFKFRNLISALDPQTSNEENVQDLQSLTDIWKNFHNADVEVSENIRGSNLFVVLAKALEENFISWKDNFPEWIGELMDFIVPYSGAKNLFPVEQITQLSNAFRKYVINECWAALRPFRRVAVFDDAQNLIMEDEELQNIVKRNINKPFAPNFFFNICADQDSQKQKLMEDKQFIFDLLAVDTNASWDVIAALAQHPDAKSLLPREVVEKASKSSYSRCTDIGALLCNDDDIKTLSLNEEWCRNMSKMFEDILEQGFSVSSSGAYLSLNEVILPLANVSVIDAEKEMLGKHVVAHLLKLVTDKSELPISVGGFRKYLKRGRQEASRALWNLAYLESNRVLISKNNGITKLQETLASEEDAIVKENIAGILHMFMSHSEPIPAKEHSKPIPAKEHSKPIPVEDRTPPKKHVMLSYNWANQKTIVKIAEALKAHGYNIWLDIEQMAGSTLEAMAGAIEQADLVLICMSQKYKDSPNCRLEGEYCMNLKVSFIPLMMQQGFRPDGWLGIALGSKLYHDFSSEENWDTKISALVKEIGERGRGNKSVSPIVPQPKENPIANWTLEEIHQWMKVEKIEQFYQIFKEHAFDGNALLELKSLHSPQNPSFFSFACDRMGITKMGDVLRLSAAIRKL